MGSAGRRIVVLGGTAGLGFQVGRLAAEQGAAIVLASSTQTRVDATTAHIPKAHGRQINLSDEAGVERFFADLGAFDRLVFIASDELLSSEIAEADDERRP